VDGLRCALTRDRVQVLAAEQPHDSVGLAPDGPTELLVGMLLFPAANTILDPPHAIIQALIECPKEPSAVEV
jgi:hypothetical protein